MPHATLKLHPGVDQNRTLALNEAAISTTNLVRFIPDKEGLGLVQKLGGWTRYPTQSASNIGSIVRALWAWEDTNSVSHLGVGCESSSTEGNALSVITEDARSVITPRQLEADIPLPPLFPSSVQGIQTTNGSPIVTINATGSSLDNYDTVYIKTQISVGGLILFGKYATTYVSGNSFQITATDITGAPQNATSTIAYPGGGAVPVFDFSAGEPYVTVTLNDHGYVAGDIFPILVEVQAGTLDLYGNYTIREVPTSNTFTIAASTTANTVATTGATGDFTTATISFSGDYTFNVGDTVVVAGVTPATYNGTYTVTAATVDSVSFLNSETAPQTVAGTLFNETSPLNGGYAKYLYFKTPGPLPVGTGYGVGGYGDGGYGTGASAPFGNDGTPVAAIDWTLDNWGEILMACIVGGEIYYWSPTSGVTRASVITNAPPVNDGMFVAMPQRQIIAWGSTFTGIQDPLLIRWSDVENYDSWIASLTNQAGSYRLPRGSKIVCGIQGPQQGLIWTDLGVWAMQYVGLPFVYQFNELGNGCGLIARKAAASMNGVIYWMGQSQFFRLSPNGVEIIRCPVWDVIFQDLDKTNLDKIRIAPNSNFGEIAWYYPTLSNGGEISAYVKYNIFLDQWDFGNLARTAWINQSVLGPPIGAGTDEIIYQHETSTDADNQPMNSSFQTGYFVLSEGEYKTFVDQIWPDMKWGYYGGAQSAQLKLTFYVADYPSDTPKQFGPYIMTKDMSPQYITPRFRGRLMSVKIESSDVGSFWRLGAMRYRFEQDGKF